MKNFDSSPSWARGRCFLALACLALGLGRAAAAVYYVDSHVTYNWGRSTSNTFDGNVFYGGHSLIPPDARAVTKRPPLRAPGSGRDGLASLDGYTLRAAPGFPKGRVIPDNGGGDFFGRPVPKDLRPSIGASETIPQGPLLPPRLR